MNKTSVIQTILFVTFCSIGILALSLAVLSRQIQGYYQQRAALEQKKQNLEKLKSLNADYDALLKNIENDPNLLNRAAKVTFGVAPNEPNTAYPKATSETLESVRLMLKSKLNNPPDKPRLPLWLKRINNRRYRLALFLAGATLVILSFIFYSRTKPSETQNQ